MPWTATTSFPHPLINVKRSNADKSLTNYMGYGLANMLYVPPHLSALMQHVGRPGQHDQQVPHARFTAGRAARPRRVERH
jgi:hypothetical protein